MKISPQLITEIVEKPCRLSIAGPNEDDPSEIYHGTVGEITEQSGALRIKIAGARKISTNDGQPLEEHPEFFCTDPKRRLTVRVSNETTGTVITLFNPPMVLTVFDTQDKLDALEIPIPA